MYIYILYIYTTCFYVYMYEYIYIYIYTNLPVDVIFRLPHPRSGDSQGQKTFIIYITYIYGDVIFDQAYNKSFHESLESLQYQASLAITRAVIVTSKERFYQQLDLEYFQHRFWFGKLCTFYKMFKNQSSHYQYGLLTTSHNPRSSRNIPLFHFKHNFFKNSFSFCNN